jgi:dTDP-glucose 4,6-dehydratase
VIPQRAYFLKDLEEISSRSSGFVRKYSGSNVLVAGATGFIGSWIISTLQHLNRYQSADIIITAVSRNVDQHLIDKFPDINFIQQDISKPSKLVALKPDCIFNAATPSSFSHGGENPREVLNAAHLGTKNLISLCRKQINPTFVNLSSGIVTKRSGDQELNLETTKDAYLQGKRISEQLVSASESLGEIRGCNLRLYAFAGPGISLVDHFAVGNFLRDALEGKAISIKGNPETRRSYLYPTDLISNILAATISEEGSVFEIGSREVVTMGDLASLINSLTGNKGINQSKDYDKPDAYFPDTENLLVKQNVELPEAITRWIEWLTAN